eukprot:SM000054S18033  [mRNA]  locus=s54:25048:31844:+ [translate_table: standard]
MAPSQPQAECGSDSLQKETTESIPRSWGLEMMHTAGEYIPEGTYSVALPEKLSDNNWAVHRSARFPLKLMSGFADSDVRTLHDNFEHGIQTYPDEPCLGSRVRQDGTVGSYEWLTYKEAGEARTAVGSGLVLQDIPKGTRVGLFFINRPEWVIVEQACNAYGYVSVPLYDTLGPDAVKYIINHAEIACIFCTRDKLQTLIDCLPDCHSVKFVVVLGGTDQVLPLSKPGSGVVYIPYSKLEAQGKLTTIPFSPSHPSDLATICYTSGTTGTPKGAMLTHSNFIASAAGVCSGSPIYTGDVHISYLPLAHIYERMNITAMLHYGVAIGFYQGDIMKLMDDLEVLKPTFFASVPRLYNRIYDRILATVKSSGGLKEYLFNVAYNAKKSALEKGRTPSPVWDRLVFNKIKARLGGRVRIMTTGASPISPEVFDFLKVCFGGRLVEGYGMTETTCTISNMDEGDNMSGHVGSPNPACEVKLVDVPEMEYTSADQPYPRGEICVRGPIVFKGYYKDEKQTKEMVDEEGWLHTGDIGLWLPGGRLKIIDRKKNIFKLAQGEYIAPEKIENVYQRSRFVQQCFVHGDSFNASLVAVVVVDPEELTLWAKGRGIQHANDLAKLCEDPVAKAAVLADMDELGKDAKLRGFEYAKNIHLVPEPFTLENDLLTPTFKIKRPQAKAFFEKEIARMYTELAAKERALPTRSKL